MADELTTTEAAAYLAEHGYTVSRRRVGGSAPPSADTLKHWALAGKLTGARKRDNRWFIPKQELDRLIDENRNLANTLANKPATDKRKGKPL